MLGIRAAVQKRNSRRSPATGNAVIRVTRFWTRPVSLWEFTSSRQESILDSNQVGQLPSLKRSKNPPLEANLFPTAFLCNPLFHIFIIIFGASGEEEEEVYFFFFFFFFSCFLSFVAGCEENWTAAFLFDLMGFFLSRFLVVAAVGYLQHLQASPLAAASWRMVGGEDGKKKCSNWVFDE